MTFLSESDFLDLISRYFPRLHPNLLLERGDDCNLISSKGNICISSDLFLEEIHFTRRYFSPGDIGYKALAVNISDISAMGARPRGFLLNLMVPEGLGTDFWGHFFDDMSRLARRFDLALAGGDLSKAGFLGIDITIWGEVNDRWLERRKCRPGNALFVIGPLGLARTGRSILETGKDISCWPKAVKAHLRPSLFVDKAVHLTSFPGVNSLMDVSDGIVSDLPRILGPELGADLLIKEDDIHPEVVKYAVSQGLSPVEFALQGGEDYSLLGCTEENDIDELRESCPELLHLGQVLPVPGIRLSGQPYQSIGFDHFSNQGNR